MAKRLYRSTTDVIIAGVCGGLGKALGIDPVFIRLFFVLGIWAGFSLLLYPVLWLILPREDRLDATVEETIQYGATEIQQQAQSFAPRVRDHARHSGTAGIVLGVLLILAGVTAFADSLNVHLYFVNFDLLWPVVLIAAGLVMIQRRTRARQA